MARWHKMDSHNTEPAASGAAGAHASGDGKKHRWGRKAEPYSPPPQPVIPRGVPGPGAPMPMQSYPPAVPQRTSAFAGAPGAPSAPATPPGGNQFAPVYGAGGTAPQPSGFDAPTRPSVARAAVAGLGVGYGTYPEGSPAYSDDGSIRPLPAAEPALPEDFGVPFEAQVAEPEVVEEISYEYTPAFEMLSEIDVNQTFGERIENLIQIAVSEADAMRDDAIADAKRQRHDAGLDAERIVAAAQRQAAEIVAAAQRRAEGDVQAAHDNRREAEAELTQAHSEAEVIRRRARDEAAELRQEIDAHAQALLARTHEDTNRTLVAARAELEHLQARKQELEGQLGQLRAMLSEAMSPKLPGLHDLLQVPNQPQR